MQAAELALIGQRQETSMAAGSQTAAPRVARASQAGRSLVRGFWRSSMLGLSHSGGLAAAPRNSACARGERWIGGRRADPPGVAAPLLAAQAAGRPRQCRARVSGRCSEWSQHAAVPSCALGSRPRCPITPSPAPCALQAQQGAGAAPALAAVPTAAPQQQQQQQRGATLLWYKRDLRLDDHLGWHQALAAGGPAAAAAGGVVPVFCFDPARYAPLVLPPGGAEGAAWLGLAGGQGGRWRGGAARRAAASLIQASRAGALSSYARASCALMRPAPTPTPNPCMQPWCGRWLRSTARCAGAAAPCWCASAPGSRSCLHWRSSWGQPALWQRQRLRLVSGQGSGCWPCRLGRGVWACGEAKQPACRCIAHAASRCTRATSQPEPHPLLPLGPADWCGGVAAAAAALPSGVSLKQWRAPLLGAHADDFRGGLLPLLPLLPPCALQGG